MSDAAYASPVTHRVGLTLGIHAENDEEAGKIAEAFYERFATDAREIDGVLWLLPVPDRGVMPTTLRLALPSGESDGD